MLFLADLIRVVMLAASVTLAALLVCDGAPADVTREQALVRWPASRTRMEVFETLQSWRTPFTPVLDGAEARAFRALEAGVAAAADGTTSWPCGAANADVGRFEA